MSIADLVDPNRRPKISRAMKAERTVQRTTFNPSSAKPGETLYVDVPRLQEDMLILPRSMFLRFKLVVEKGHADNHLVQNVSRNLVENMKVFFGGECIRDTVRYDLFHGYHDMLTCEEDVLAGITPEAKRKAREKNSGDAKVLKQTATTYGNRYVIPLSHEVLDEHGAFYPFGLKSDLRFEIKLADSKTIVVTSDNSKAHGYELTNIQLEYSTIEDHNLAQRASESYLSGRTFFFEDVHHFATREALAIGSGAMKNFHVNTPRSCMKGIMMLFVKKFNSGARNAEEFVNPLVNSVDISIGGVPHKVFSDGIKREDTWQLIRKRIGDGGASYARGLGEHFKEVDFHNDKFALWIDLRSTPVNDLHGDGIVVGRSQDGVRIALDVAGVAGVTVNVHIFVVSDAAVLVRDGLVREVKIQPSS